CPVCYWGLLSGSFNWLKSSFENETGLVDACGICDFRVCHRSLSGRCSEPGSAYGGVAGDAWTPCRHSLFDGGRGQSESQGSRGFNESDDWGLCCQGVFLWGIRHADYEGRVGAAYCLRYQSCQLLFCTSYHRGVSLTARHYLDIKTKNDLGSTTTDSRTRR